MLPREHPDQPRGERRRGMLSTRGTHTDSESDVFVARVWGNLMFVGGMGAYSAASLEGVDCQRVRVSSVVSKPQAAFWASLPTIVRILLRSGCAPWVMSPGGQSNLLLIRRLLHPSTPGFDPIRGRFFAQVLPKFFRRETPQPRLRISASKCVVLIRKKICSRIPKPNSPGRSAQWLPGDICLQACVRN